MILEKSNSGTQELKQTTESKYMPTLIQATAFIEYWCKALQLIHNSRMYKPKNFIAIPQVVNKPMLSYTYSGTVPMLQGHTLFSQK
jgi:hypothetical protein